MPDPIFAMPGPGLLLMEWPGFLAVLLIVIVLVTASKGRGKWSGRARSAGLGLMAIVCGPLMGVALASLQHLLGAVHPADVGYTYGLFSFLGVIAGLFAGIAFGLTGLFCPPEDRWTNPPEKLADPWNEL